MLRRLLKDEILIESPSGERVGPIKASVQSNKIFVFDTQQVIDSGSKIYRTLPNGKSECHHVLDVDFHHGLKARESYYEITTRKESSLVSTPSSTTINISNSQCIQIGDGNVQNIVASFETLLRAIDSANCTEEEKASAKQKLKDVLSHPLVAAILGSAAGSLVAML